MTILRSYHFPDLLPQYFDNLSTQIYSVFDIPELDPTMFFEVPSSPGKNLRKRRFLNLLNILRFSKSFVCP